MLATKAADTIGTVVQLGSLVEAEIVDIDPTATMAEVLEAIREAASQKTPELAKTITVTGLWPIKVGTQVAKMARRILMLIEKVKIDWTLARVRERALAPIRCYQCHGFGHTKNACKGPDLPSACRKCGEGGHLEGSCTAEGRRCVACERLGYDAPSTAQGQ